MCADKTIRPLGDRGHFRNAQTRGVGEKQAMRGNDCFEFCIDFLLQVHQFDDNLHNHIGVRGCFLQIKRGFDAAQNSVHLLFGDFALFHITVQVLFDRVHAAVDEPLLNVSEGNVKTCSGANLCDSISHQARTQHTYFFNFHKSLHVIYCQADYSRLETTNRPSKKDP